MLGVIRNGARYLGTDPNYMLCERLTRMAHDYAQTTNSLVDIDIRAHGSERVVQEWEGIVGLAFSSPPYYDEEDYVIGEQSYTPGKSYSNWLDTYITPTITNIYRYLIPDGVFCINVKNIGDIHLEDDVLDIARQNGFELFNVDKLENHRRPHAQCGLIDNSEKIYCFRKSPIIKSDLSTK